MVYGLFMVSMLFAFYGAGMPLWFGGGFNPAMSFAAMLLKDEKSFVDGVGYNRFWFVYIVAPYLAGAIASYAFKLHCQVYERFRHTLLKQQTSSSPSENRIELLSVTIQSH
jgi:hypothetical protein